MVMLYPIDGILFYLIIDGDEVEGKAHCRGWWFLDPREGIGRLRVFIMSLVFVFLLCLMRLRSVWSSVTYIKWVFVQYLVIKIPQRAVVPQKSVATIYAKINTAK